ncbi:MAG: hypothetical protein CML19_11425 [Pusillimonas sp.]|nr:hypothetical protein [Pusillimonas sp.]
MYLEQTQSLGQFTKPAELCEYSKSVPDAPNRSCLHCRAIPSQTRGGSMENRDRDVEDFPIGSVVVTPTGKTGVVVAHKGYESKFDPFMRVMIKLDGGDRQDVVQLQPKYLRMLGDEESRISVSGQLMLKGVK